MNNPMQSSASHPEIVGRYLVEGESIFLPVRRQELDRTATAMMRTIATFKIAPGRYVLTVSLTQEVVQFAPFEQACSQIGLIGTNADASQFDAGRVESLIRQFNVAAICGVNRAVLDGLEGMGHDPVKVFAGRIVWARPDAFDALAACPDVIARRCAEVGPVLGLECAAGKGMHVDGREWNVTATAGTIILDSRMSRFEDIVALDTRIAAKVDTEPCTCGVPGPRVLL